jgi:cytochrome bd-type quinol oxidase subunit 2
MLSVLIGTYLLLLADGIAGEMSNQTHGWYFWPLPAHPRLRIVAYLTIATALQFGSAWLLMPATDRTDSKRFWAQYAARVACLIAACFAVAVVAGFVLMALLDSGTI